MEKVIRSHKWQEEVVYDDDMIAWNGNDWIAPGIGNRTNNKYEIVFDEMPVYNYEFWCCDIRKNKEV